nr:crossover junction endonuclease EME1 [Nothobranchius furzeri]XP_015830050.2 crossover junction endonuclease EME1 [Nothobranchius furzeri]
MDGTSDPDDELPTFDFLQPTVSQVSRRTPEVPDSGLSDPAALFPHQRRGPVPDTVTISSDSEDEAPYVPLAQRLKNRRDPGILSSSVKDAALCCPSGPAQPPSLDRVATEARQDCEDVFVTLVSVPENKDTNPGKQNITKSTVENVGASREMDGMRRARERRQQDQEKKALAEAAKALRPEERIKHMVVAVDPAHLQLEGGATLLASLQALGCSCAIEKQPFPLSVSWSRRAACAQDSVCVPEAQVVMQITVKDFITLINNYIQEVRHGRSDCGPTLASWVQQLQKHHPSKIFSLAVIELEEYFRAQKCCEQKKVREAVTGKGGRTQKERKKPKNGDVQELAKLSRVDVEEAVVHLQLHNGVSVHFFSTWREFSDYITMTTKALAEAPFKREREQTSFSFCLESEWAGGQRVNKAGEGLLLVWKRQIQQLHRVSSEVAAAVVAAYPSPLLLQKTYSECRTESEKVSLLSDLLVRRGEGITSTTQRAGPELSKRLYLLMHSCDPEVILDSCL